MKLRLQKIIAHAGVASRRAAENMILNGRVSVNGMVVTKLGSSADPYRDRIEIDGIPLITHVRNLYIMLHKPAGFITSLHDPCGRPTVIQCLANINERVFPVGRLDYDTEGLLILTNDGDFAHLLLHPRHAFKRVYLVKVHGKPSPHDLERLRTGIIVDGVMMKTDRVDVGQQTTKNMWIKVVLTEGRNHQIKKMFEAIGYRTMRIIRTGFGPLQLGNLRPGAWRLLTRDEIQKVRRSAFAKKPDVTIRR
ncbi:MAG: rRNA pseudouridine synthase [Desulfobacterota bacterium]|nr:rRNA pseudouridine synthase [Thermodesulfobacteriota bacterium]